MTNAWKKSVATTEQIAAYGDFVRRVDKDLGAFLAFDAGRLAAGTTGTGAAGTADETAGPLSGLPFGVKDNIAVEGMNLTCGSHMLETVRSPYSATAVTRLEEAGATVVGKTNLDEFGMGSSTANSALATTVNPWDSSRVPGGSSGGSAAAVAAGLVPFALGSDTGGSIRQPAAFCGVYGFKPTYGTVSRYGLVAYASSLEVIGVAAESSALCRDVFQAMRGEDARDHSSVAYPDGGTTDDGAAANAGAGGSARRIGVLSSLPEVDPAVARAFDGARTRYEELGYEIVEIDLPTLEYVVPVYYTIATAEASANLARFNGVRYGHRPDYAENPQELVRKSREEGFGAEVKLRILVGTYVLRSGFQDEYYLRAQKIRTAIRRDLARVFDEVDLIMTPVFPTQAFPRGEGAMDPFQQKLADQFTATANLAGIPAISVPTGVEDGLPAAVQLMAPAFGEERLFQAAGDFEAALPPPHPEGLAPFPRTAGGGQPAGSGSITGAAGGRGAGKGSA
ncbi:MAG: Asp-tRNA(Asn)/Glu-tRNA(Gln) amidotransferase subunit GatA [Spirochaetes bacterium]|jgi:aspartyl-tRNA(Asn)/glutamyl-tRNA(Gln) amidotransferase subunit A|nr:Asp-tRNA(Asn)/Glu-tRNA(Gln) amidotransferase subunit GatA [Spirochaetota bacterium]